VIVYGRNAVREALRGRRTVKRIWATKNALREPWLAAASSVQAEIASSEEIEQRCGSQEHQGVCADVSEFLYASPEELLSASPGRLIVVLDQVQDPQNLGAICRTAECAGSAAVVIGERRSAQITPAVCKASAGAVEHLPVARARNVADFLAAAKRAGRWCYGADAEAPLRYDEVEYDESSILVLGSEGRGLRPRVAGQCDQLVSIPLRGELESLSVSAAAAVLIYGLTAPSTSVNLPRGS
jgi:23S rRNA (guanosine2251-2'-O)-methyltransferase